MKLTYILESVRRLFKSRLFIAVASVLLIALTVTFTVICINWINNEGDSSVRYTVVFDSQGGSSVAPQKIPHGEYITLPDKPQKDGFIFDGWYCDGLPWSFKTEAVVKNVVLEARWLEAVTVTFDDGEEITEIYCAIGKPIDESVVPIISDTDFCGWYCGGERWSFKQAVEGDVLLTAAWHTELKLDASEDISEPFSDSTSKSKIEDAESVSFTALSGEAHILFGSEAPEGALDLVRYLRYMPNLSAFLDGNPEVKGALLSDDGKIYGVPSVTSIAYPYPTLTVREDWIRTLLNGEGEFSSTRSDNISTAYLPTEEGGRYEIDVAGYGTIIKNTALSGNVISIMNAYADVGGLDGASAVNLLRSYIDTAYGGYYGTERADLFIGPRAVWSADELVALMRCVIANSDSLGIDCASGILINDGSEYSLLRLCIDVFACKELDRDRGQLTLSDGTFKYSGKLQTVQKCVYAINGMLKEGLITLDKTNTPLVTYGARDERGGYTELCAPFAKSVTTKTNGKERRVLMQSTYKSACDMKSIIYLSSSTVEPDNKRLFAALRVIDLLYSDALLH